MIFNFRLKYFGKTNFEEPTQVEDIEISDENVVEIEVFEEEAPFLKGQTTKGGMILSPIKIVKNPDGTNHQNIRNFMKTGWEGIAFYGSPLQLK